MLFLIFLIQFFDLEGFLRTMTGSDLQYSPAKSPVTAKPVTKSSNTSSSIATTLDEGLIVGMRSFPGNP